MQTDFVAETHDKLVAGGVDRPAQLVVLVGGEPALVELEVVGAFDAHCRVGVLQKPRHLDGGIRGRLSEHWRESG
jgi:hypothetical protein